MGAFKEYAFGGGSIGSYKPMADLGDTPANLHAAAEKKITQSDLDQIEKYADRLFASLDIDVEFTRHFMQNSFVFSNKHIEDTARRLRSCLTKQTLSSMI